MPEILGTVPLSFPCAIETVSPNADIVLVLRKMYSGTYENKVINFHSTEH